MRHNGCDSRPQQRSLGLPGQSQRLTREEVAEQASQALAQLRAKDPPRRLNPNDAPRRAVALITPKGEDYQVRLVCGHELVVDGCYSALQASLPQRCLTCLSEGRA